MLIPAGMQTAYLSPNASEICGRSQHLRLLLLNALGCLNLLIIEAKINTFCYVCQARNAQL